MRPPEFLTYRFYNIYLYIFLLSEHSFLYASMDSEDELDLMLLAVVLIKKKKEQRKKRGVWVQDIYKNRQKYGILHVVGEMELTNRDAYFK